MKKKTPHHFPSRLFLESSMFDTITIKKSLFPIFFGCLFAHQKLTAQVVDVYDPYRAEVVDGYKNLIKTNVAQPFFGVYGVAWERWLNRNFSSELSGSLLRSNESLLSEFLYGFPMYGRPRGTGYHLGLGLNALFDEDALGDLFGIGIKVDYRNFAKFEAPEDFHVRGLSTALYLNIQNDLVNLFILDYRAGVAFHNYRISTDRTQSKLWFFLNINIGFPF